MKDISFTFGIISETSKSEDRISTILHSIAQLNIPQYEVIIVGQKTLIEGVVASMSGPAMRMPIRCIDFNENQKKAWITRKKNLITQAARYENIVYQHDYIRYDPGWYEAWKEFGEDYHACMNAIVNIDGTRYRDWSIFHSDDFAGAKAFAEAMPQECLLPYDETSLSRWMYFSGAYFVAKKKIMQEFPLNERLSWGQGEDCEWSYAFRKKYPFSINAKAKVHMLKYNHPIFWPVREQTLAKLKEYTKLQDEGKI